MDMFNDTTLDDYYGDAEMTFKEIYAVVRYKMLHNEQMLTAREEMMEDFIKDWADSFGADSLD